MQALLELAGVSSVCTVFGKCLMLVMQLPNYSVYTKLYCVVSVNESRNSGRTFSSHRLTSELLGILPRVQDAVSSFNDTARPASTTGVANTLETKSTSSTGNDRRIECGFEPTRWDSDTLPITTSGVDFPIRRH